MTTRILLLIAAGLAGAVYVSLPGGTRAVPAMSSGGAPHVRGAVHVHSTYSDGGGTLDDIAAAAARAGLDFVIVTDHGDGTRPPQAPSYRSGVLCLDAVEVSTDGGHVVALGLGPTPYPLGGDARDVVEDITRLGGLSIAAHPGSAKPELRWTAWDAGVDGFEWLNGDSEWRDEGPLSLLRVLLAYPFARARALGLVLDRPEATLARWDEMGRTRRLVGLGGADAHARLAFTDTEPRNGRLALHIPTYEDVFRVYSVTLPALHLTGQAVADAQALLSELRAGHVYTSVDILATPAQLTFAAMSAGQTFSGGDEIRTGAPVMITVNTNAPTGARTTLLQDGIPTTVADGPSLRFDAGPEPAVYRVELAMPGAPGEPAVPWVVSNPIYVRRPDAPVTSLPPAAAVTMANQFAGESISSWRVESNVRSKGALDLVVMARANVGVLRWALGGARSDDPYVALVVPAGPDIALSEAVQVTARASRPMRVSLQMRDAEGRRWRRSVYLDDVAREVLVPIAAFTPLDAGGAAPSPASIRDLLIVVDVVNARPGTNGQVLVERIAYRR